MNEKLGFVELSFLALWGPELFLSLDEDSHKPSKKSDSVNSSNRIIRWASRSFSFNVKHRDVDSVL